MARSLAFWIEKEKGNDVSMLKAELHFNYWFLPEQKVNFLDIGVRLGMESGDFSKICFYFPFNLKGFVFDTTLSEIMLEKVDLISAVFNSSIEGSSPKQDYTDYNLSDGTNSSAIRFFKKLSKNTPNSHHSGYVLENYEADGDVGCTLSFPKEMFDVSVTHDNYFRFRLKLQSSDIISKVNRSTGNYITTDFDEHELVDFRVNESRNLPDGISKKIIQCSYLKKVHFFLIRDAYSDYKGAHSAYERCRLLEDDLWKDYLSPIELTGNAQMLIYHWKASAKEPDKGIDHFASFAKFTKRVVTKTDLFKIAIFIILIGLCVNWLSYAIPKGIHCLPSGLESDQNLESNASKVEKSGSNENGGESNEKQSSS